MSTREFRRTYAFKEGTLKLMNYLKSKLNENETDLIHNALKCLQKEIFVGKELQDNIEILIDKIADLSYKLGYYEDLLEKQKDRDEV